VAQAGGRHLGALDAVSYLAPGVEAATVRAGGEAVYWYVSVLASEVSPGENARAVARRKADGLDASFRAILDETEPEDLRLDELFDRDPIEDWGTGVVSLLGDAAHPMLPHTGQGAAQAIEDAVALGLALDGADDLGLALRRYARVRARHVRSIVLRGRRIAAATTTNSRFVGWLRAAAVRRMPMSRLVAAYLHAGAADPHRELRRAASESGHR
jgi:2-polyprenyl-6-methoxyphenol hydroxylase-like FAD-dependent oxidoreductase